MTARRRTPAEMAQDRLAKAEKKLADLLERRGAAIAQVDRLTEAISEATKTRGWLAQNPLLQESEQVEGGED